jgi:quinolinate synthase
MPVLNFAPPVQADLPPGIEALSAEEIDARTREAKRALGSRLVILGHHYQRDEVIRHADYTGDSFGLSRTAAGLTDVEFIVFCGVHFMAESADVLTGGRKIVVLPDMRAGCSMADMADIDQVQAAWDVLAADGGGEILPITYMNSAADLKAFVGRHSGAVCTSSNARAVLAWAMERAPRVLFFPDQHLGRNTGAALGIPLDRMVVWDPRSGPLGAAEGASASARVLLWKGHCSVHNRYTVEHVQKVRADNPGVKVLVHPECRYEVVRASDDCGSTEHIIKTIEASSPGSAWAIGTEFHLVKRLADRFPDRRIVTLEGCVCFCATMYRITPPHLLWSLENLVAGRIVNQIRVPEDTAHWARIALDRMLEIT